MHKFHIANQNIPLNVLGQPLESCCKDPMTGYFRDGYCRTIKEDVGAHVICVIMTDEFLTYSQKAGNDLTTPNPDYDFPGLKAGDCWCLCATRWQDAMYDGVAPPVKLASTHMKALEVVTLDDLRRHVIQ